MPLPQQFEQKETLKTPEVIKSPDVSKESKIESKPEKVKPVEDLSAKQSAAVPLPSEDASISVGDSVKEIEKILEDNLRDIYKQMPPEKQLAFTKQGEETAQKIGVLLSSAKVKFQKILGLIKKWLKLIPGINQFFLEQEAKIKADRIMFIHRQKHGREND